MPGIRGRTIIARGPITIPAEMAILRSAPSGPELAKMAKNWPKIGRNWGLRESQTCSRPYGLIRDNGFSPVTKSLGPNMVTPWELICNSAFEQFASMGPHEKNGHPVGTGIFASSEPNWLLWSQIGLEDSILIEVAM
ncbi:hypothetical protein BS47DRAFT_1369272 [Hydnum rufescens UP504]|uniref:Uncharacterized protein n=1 Tax=Hydnum rufescens UP504 TaxID=1448309 RepID=A0A9P6ADP2_9AGAM|nr:hypothetical protein BS47DRAFT_1369272 [Hydnum rufescens UP504]